LIDRRFLPEFMKNDTKRKGIGKTDTLDLFIEIQKIFVTEPQIYFYNKTRYDMFFATTRL